MKTRLGQELGQTFIIHVAKCCVTKGEYYSLYTASICCLQGGWQKEAITSYSAAFVGHSWDLNYKKTRINRVKLGL